MRVTRGIDVEVPCAFDRWSAIRISLTSARMLILARAQSRERSLRDGEFVRYSVASMLSQVACSSAAVGPIAATRDDPLSARSAQKAE
jgi:hypothetical protein